MIFSSATGYLLAGIMRGRACHLPTLHVGPLHPYSLSPRGRVMRYLRVLRPSACTPTCFCPKARRVFARAGGTSDHRVHGTYARSPCASPPSKTVTFSVRIVLTNSYRLLVGIVVFVAMSALLYSPWIHPTLIVPAVCASLTL